VLLFDDVFSEFDATRSRQLLSLTDRFDQVILTTPRVPTDDVPDRYERIELAT
jgi:recombinational DNA repair ATPase RecF